MQRPSSRWTSVQTRRAVSRKSSELFEPSKRAIDSALGRDIVAELRNDGHVEEEVRGRIRLTPRGYRAFQNDPPPYSYRNCPTPRVVSRTDDAPSPAPEATSGLRRLCDNI